MKIRYCVPLFFVSTIVLAAPMTNAALASGPLDLIWQSGFVAKVVLLILLASSIVTWAIVFKKWKQAKKLHTDSLLFTKTFRTVSDLEDLYKRSQKSSAPAAKLFHVAYEEFKKPGFLPPHQLVDNIQRTLTKSSLDQTLILEKHVDWLATIASASPFVGLFGTVWGIMNSFQSIGLTGAANLAVVAPGISEALITTATGLAVAIPAVVAYNAINNRIKVISLVLDGFSQELLNTFNRQAKG